MEKQNEINMFEIFMDKVSSIIADIHIDGTVDLDELCPIWGTIPNGFRPWDMSEDDILAEEQRILYEEFLSSLTLEEYRDYCEEQQEWQKTMWELDMVS
jgi:hypothetical protein